MNSTDLASFSNFLKQSQLSLIILPTQATFDQQLAASSLHISLGLSQKKSSLLGVKMITNPSISGLDQLSTKLGSNHLLIGFDYLATAVDKVSYHLDEKSNKFYLTIKPQKGEQPLDKDTVQLEYVGADADLIILFGINELEELEQLYLGYEDLFKSANIISINSAAPNFQCNHIDTSQTSSACEVVYNLLSLADIKIESDSATNLFAGIQYETNNFLNFKANADTFEVVASLLRFGARRKTGGFEKPINAANEKPDFEVVSENEEKIIDQETNIANKTDTNVFGGKGKKSTPTIIRPSGLRK